MFGNVRFMGIVNATDDSYYENSRVKSIEAFAKRCEKLINSGASIIDLGACSTRPGFSLISEDEEWDRLKPLLKEYQKQFNKTELSIDTFRSGIVRKAAELLDFRFTVNDITSGDYDADMLNTAGRNGLKYIAMHHKGNLDTIHQIHSYKDIVRDVVTYFENFDKMASEFGIVEYWIDPGFGFSKSIEDNIVLLDRIKELTILNKPIVIGISRKSFIYKPLGLQCNDTAVLAETVRLEKKAITDGVSVIRLHEIPQELSQFESDNK